MDEDEMKTLVEANARKTFRERPPDLNLEGNVSSCVFAFIIILKVF